MSETPGKQAEEWSFNTASWQPVELRAGQFLALFDAARWIATKGNTQHFDTRAEEHWRSPVQAIVQGIVGGTIRAIGRDKDGQTGPIPALAFEDRKIAYPSNSSPDEWFFPPDSTKPHRAMLRIRSSGEPERWETDWNDQISTRTNIEWSHIKVAVDDILPLRDWKDQDPKAAPVLLELMQRGGMVPVCEALYWLMTKGGTEQVDYGSEPIWRPSIEGLLRAISASRTKVVGKAVSGSFVEVPRLEFENVRFSWAYENDNDARWFGNLTSREKVLFLQGACSKRGWLEHCNDCLRHDGRLLFSHLKVEVDWLIGEWPGIRDDAGLAIMAETSEYGDLFAKWALDRETHQSPFGQRTRNRDGLLAAAALGIIDDKAAERIALKLNCGPLACKPEPSQFDPMQEPFWTLPMALAWIANRERLPVVEQLAEFRDKWTYWFFEENIGLPKHGNPNGYIVQKSWSVEKVDPPSIQRLLDEAWRSDTFNEHAIPDARKALWAALSERKLTATGRRDSDSRRDVPEMLWQELYPSNKGIDGVESLREKYDFTQKGFTGQTACFWDSVTVRRDDLLRIWPDKAGFTGNTAEAKSFVQNKALARPFAMAEARLKYKEYVDEWPAGQKTPSRDDDLEFMRRSFAGISGNIVRQLRRQLAPDDWRRRGRPSNKKLVT